MTQTSGDISSDEYIKSGAETAWHYFDLPKKKDRKLYLRRVFSTTELEIPQLLS